MRFPRPRRLARWRVHLRGLVRPGRPGGGVLLLERRPRAGGRRPSALAAAVLICGLGCVVASLLYRSLQGPPPMILVVLGLVAVGALPANQVLRLLVNREQLRISSRRLEYLRIDGLSREWRRIPLRTIRRLSVYILFDRRDDHWRHAEYGLAIETLGRPLWVGPSRDPDAVDRLRGEVERILRERVPNWNGDAGAADCEILDHSGTLPRLPSDSTLSCRREWDRTEFTGRPPVDGLDGLLYGLISVAGAAILGLVLGGIRPGLDRSSTLVLAGSIVLPVLIGWWVRASQGRRWEVRPGEVRTSIPGPGLLWSRTTEIEWLDRIELRRLPAGADTYARRAPGFELALVDLDGEDAVVFGPLTEGEARWMAGIVAEILKDALPRGGQEIYRWSVSVEEPVNGSRAMADAWLDEVLPDLGSGGTAREKRAREPADPEKMSESSDRGR